MKKKALLFVLLILALTVKSQQIDSLLEVYRKQVPQENLHIHFDNSSYSPGQTIFFKGYLLRGNELSQESKILYVDWIDKDGIVINRTVSPIVGFTWSGSYDIPANYAGNQIHLIAYTKWMLNFDSAYLFRRSFPILQKNRKVDDPNIKENEQIQLSFFPEGGNLVEGLGSTVAFKAVNVKNEPSPISGNIYNKSHELVIPFAVIHNGMGKVKLKPGPDEKFVAEWTDKYGNLHAVELPYAIKSGVVFSVNNDSGSTSITVERTNRDTSFENLLLVGTSNQKLIFKASLDFGGKTAIRSVLPVTQFPSGIIVLTIFDKRMAPLCERIFFNDNKDYEIPVKLNTDTIDFGHRQKNRFSIQLLDSIESSISVAITSGEGFYDSTQNIVSQMLLTSELKGRIYNPAFYFSNNDSARKCLDLVMLTNGWRRFKWQDVLTGSNPTISYPVENTYINLLGNIGNKLNKKVKNPTIALIKKTKTSKHLYAIIPVQKDGSFIDSNLLFYDSMTVHYQSASNIFTNSNNVLFKSSLLPFRRGTRIRLWNDFSTFNYSQSEEFYKKVIEQQNHLSDLMAKTTLAEVTVHTKVKTRTEELDDIYTTGAFKDAVKSIDIEADVVATSFPSVISYLQNRNTTGSLIFDIYNRDAPIRWSGTGAKNDAVTAFFVDQIQLNPGEIFNFSMADIAYIKIFPPPFSMAKMNGAGGAIAIYTKKGVSRNISGLPERRIEGFSVEKEFYNQVYDIADQKNDWITDVRQTLLWIPNIIIGNGKRSIELPFFNNSIGNSYRVTIEGLSSDGRLIHNSTFYHK